MEKHILICGERGVGKSTLIRRLLAESALPVGGFVTRRLPQADGDGMFPIYLHAAALPPEERLIRVYMDMKGTQLYLSFTNFTASKKKKKQNGRFQTTKGEGHGYGLIRMDTIIDRLDGYINRNSEDGAFTTEILIPQK